MAAHKMDALLESLESAADALGLKVSYESLGETAYGGGLCKVRGRYRIIIDKRNTVGEKVSTVARALAVFDTQGVAMSAAARELVDSLVAERRARGATPLAAAAR
jgi:hypothetical protein